MPRRGQSLRLACCQGLTDLLGGLRPRVCLREDIEVLAQQVSPDLRVPEDRELPLNPREFGDQVRSPVGPQQRRTGPHYLAQAGDGRREAAGHLAVAAAHSDVGEEQGADVAGERRRHDLTHRVRQAHLADHHIGAATGDLAQGARPLAAPARGGPEVRERPGEPFQGLARSR